MSSLLGCEKADRLVRTSSDSLNRVTQQAIADTTKAGSDVKAITDEISGMVSARGGVWKLDETDGEIQVNAGGTVFPVSRQALLMPAMVRKYISVLLMHHANGLPRDENGRVYLEVSPAYFEAFLDELTLYKTGRTNRVELHVSSKRADPSSSDYHALFMQEIHCYSHAGPAAASASVEPTADSDGGGGDGESGGATDDVDTAIQRSVRAYEYALRTHAKAYKGLELVRDEIKRFLTAMEPFFASQDGGESQVLTLTDNVGRPVSVMRKTLMRLGPDHPLLTRFSTTPPCWDGRQVDKTPARHFVKIVDFARRIATLPPGQLIRPPLVEQGKMRHFIEDTEMYGFKYQPYCRRPADGHEYVAKSAEEWGRVVAMTGKNAATPTLVYKSSRDTFAYGPFLQKVNGKSGLLFALRDGDTHRFGAFIDGPLTPPADPTETNCYKAPVFFFSLSGAYDAPTKIEMPEDSQWVNLAGTQGVVKDTEDEPLANVGIGGGAAALWLGFAVPGPAADLSSCQQWLGRDELPDGYKGQTNHQDRGTLANKKLRFTCKELEVWHMRR
ncbi:unnamed protein product [Vitrella brassicaformis CCMP3155]|uniref:TLDc domain-containing protein n=2 Tax=Vitrella brassicaformis TaxID=1169539 RepID=A0A0G4EIX8_VITBC|nr:unnamed protein product [Vitrella brassicaformis CCMP3155]|eukprot:CEL95976.1 unnamed protein product [Vitrella brassicaformis CCMP3155]